MAVMMTCGHAANSTHKGKPSCVICGVSTVATETPNLEGRTATCTYCRRATASATNLPFFNHRPELTTDSYYCGCRGWD